MGKTNAYSLFINEEYRRRQRAGDNVNKNALYGQCSGKWASLPDEIKQQYKDRAKNGNAGPPIMHAFNNGRPEPSSFKQQIVEPVSIIAPKIDSESTDVKPDVKHVVKTEQGVKRDNSQLEVYETEEERAAKRAKLGFAVPNWRNIKNSSQPDVERYSDYNLLKLRDQCNSIILTKSDKLVSTPIYTFSVNVLCKQRCDDKDKFIPIEIGIYAYSIEKGRLCEPYHVLIDSGPVPSGCFNKSKDHAINHKITFNSSGGYPPEARTDYGKIYKEMLKYTKGSDRTILIADERDLAQVRGCIEWIYEKSALTTSGPGTWTILPIVEYVASATNFIHQKMLHKEKSIFALHYFLKLQLETSSWDYNEDLMCSYHAKPENSSKWCAKNCAQRTINCLESQLEDIYKMYKQATAPPPAPQQPQPQPQFQMPQPQLAHPAQSNNTVGYPIPPNAQNHQLPRLNGQPYFISSAPRLPTPVLMPVARPQMPNNAPNLVHEAANTPTSMTKPPVLAIEGSSRNPLDPRLKRSYTPSELSLDKSN